MNPKFIYAMGKDSRDTLLSLGYMLLSSNETNQIFVFVNMDIGTDVPTLKFNVSDGKYVLSDVLTF